MQDIQLGFNDVPEGPPDPILIMSYKYREDTNEKKVNLSVGAYRDEDGKPYVFPVIKKAEQMIVSDPNMDKEYSKQEGLPDFQKGARGALLGWNHPDVDSGRVATCQSVSGQGALRLLAEFIQKFAPATIHISKPTWGNHMPLFKNKLGFDVKEYRYYKPETCSLDFEGMMEDLSQAEPGSWVLLHTCAHNPTGVDPSFEQWQQLCKLFKEKKLRAFFDTAYQGFVTGNLDEDGKSLRHFVAEGLNVVVAQSFAKIMGLYGERTGALHVVCDTPETAAKVLSQFRILVRINYSFPPIHGARIASLVLNNEELRNQWLEELINVTNRITKCRKLLKEALINNSCPGNWDHITNQIGMFSFTGLTPEQSTAMIEKYSIYMTVNGRISICGLTEKNVQYVADCMKLCVENY